MEDPLARAKPRPELRKVPIGVVSEEAKPQDKTAREELPDLIDKFKVNEEEIEELGESLESLYKRGNSEKDVVQRIVANLECDGIQMQEAITKHDQVRESTILENVNLQRLADIMRQEKGKVERENLELQVNSNRLSSENENYKQQARILSDEKEEMAVKMQSHILHLNSEISQIKGVAKDLGYRNEEVKNAMAELQKENDHLASLKQKLQLTVSDMELKIQQDEEKLETFRKGMEEMEEKFIRQQIEHEELKATLKEKKIVIAQKNRDYQGLLEKNKAQKLLRMT